MKQFRSVEVASISIFVMSLLTSLTMGRIISNFQLPLFMVQIQTELRTLSITEFIVKTVIRWI